MLPEGLENFGTGAFYGTGITEIVLPSTLTQLHQYSLTEGFSKTVIFTSVNPPTHTGNTAIATYVDIIYVPVESLDAYKEALPEYASFMVGY